MTPTTFDDLYVDGCPFCEGYREDPHPGLFTWCEFVWEHLLTHRYEYRLMIHKGKGQAEVVTISEDLIYIKNLRNVTPIKKEPIIQRRPVPHDWETINV